MRGNILTKFIGILVLVVVFFRPIDAVCDRSNRMIAAEDTCWTAKVKFSDRVQHTTKSVLNFAKEKLGIGREESFQPEQCDYYQCIFGELKMLNDKNYPNFHKITEWIDNNIIYNHAKVLYLRLNLCNSALAKSVETNSYFYGDLTTPSTQAQELQETCDVLKEFMKCLAMEETDCVIFKYP